MMRVRGTLIEDTYAEAFAMRAARVVVTACDGWWARRAGESATGYGTSIIGCDAEAGVEVEVAAGETPDGRAGVALLFFARGQKGLIDAVRNRAGQCLMTCATTAVFDGLSGSGEEGSVEGSAQGYERFDVGEYLSYFGDGYQRAERAHGRACWKVPVMDGWFVVEGEVGSVAAVGGGNLLVCGEDQAGALAGARRAAQAVESMRGVITPFPGGVVRCGSKVGSRYQGVGASTNDAYCPGLRGEAASKLADGVGCVYEVVIDGLNRVGVERAMRVGIEAACGEGVVVVTAGNYGGRLGGNRGELRLGLREVMAGGG